MRDLRAEINEAFDSALSLRAEECLTILLVMPSGQVAALAPPMRILPTEIEKIGAWLKEVPIEQRDRYLTQQVTNAMEHADQEPGAAATAAQFAYYRLYRDLPSETFDAVRFVALLVHETKVVVLAGNKREEITESALTFLDRGELTEQEAMTVPSRTIN